MVPKKNGKYERIQLKGLHVMSDDKVCAMLDGQTDGQTQLIYTAQIRATHMGQKSVRSRENQMTIYRERKREREKEKERERKREREREKPKTPPQPPLPFLGWSMGGKQRFDCWQFTEENATKLKQQKQKRRQTSPSPSYFFLAWSIGGKQGFDH